MKRYNKGLIFLAMAGMVAVVAVCAQRETKRKQAQAKAQGRHIPYGPYEAVCKRPLDVVLSSLALLLLAPVMGLTALFVRVKLGSPVFFTQERPGLDGKVFRIFKFRTMTEERDSEGKLLADGDRLTGFGRMLRASSLDELPELVNILKGDMSIVGPRPLLVEYLPYYTEREKQRHGVLPGLTGYAQAHGRNAVGWGDRLEMDAEYAGHITFLGDMGIILGTVSKVLARDGISSASSATMENFISYAENREGSGKSREQTADQCSCPGLHD